MPFFWEKGLKKSFFLIDLTWIKEASLRIFINIIVKEEVDDCSYLYLPPFFFSFFPQNQVQILTFELELFFLVSGAEDTSAQFSRRSPNSAISELCFFFSSFFFFLTLPPTPTTLLAAQRHTQLWMERPVVSLNYKDLMFVLQIQKSFCFI